MSGVAGRSARQAGTTTILQESAGMGPLPLGPGGAKR